MLMYALNSHACLTMTPNKLFADDLIETVFNFGSNGTNMSKQWGRDPVRNVAIILLRILHRCREELDRTATTPTASTPAWSNKEFYTQFTKTFIRERSSGPSRAIAWKTRNSDQLRYFNTARTLMVRVALDGTITNFVSEERVRPNIQALEAFDALQEDWHYIPKHFDAHWKTATKKHPTFFSQELFQQGKSIGAQNFIAARIMIGRWIHKSRDSGHHETKLSKEIGSILNTSITPTVRFSYLFDYREQAVDTLKKLELKLFLPAIVNAGAFSDLHSIEMVAMTAQGIAEDYIRDVKGGNQIKNATPSQCGELWAAILPAYKFDHWKLFMQDPTDGDLPTEIYIENTLTKEKQLLVAAALSQNEELRRHKCIDILKKCIPISAAYLNRLVQLRAKWFISVLNNVQGTDATIRQTRSMMLKRHQKVLDDHST